MLTTKEGISDSIQLSFNFDYPLVFMGIICCRKSKKTKGSKMIIYALQFSLKSGFFI